MEIEPPPDVTQDPETTEIDRVRSAIRSILPVVVGAALAVFFFCRTFVGKQTDFANVALGKFTSAVYAEHDGFPIHMVKFGSEYVDGWKQRGCQPVVLWLGNSQLHGVNQYIEGQETVAPRFFRRLQRQGYDTLVVSPASATPEEQYVLFEHIRSSVDLRCVAIGVVFVNWRLHQVRDSVKKSLRDDRVNTALKSTDSGQSLLSRFGDEGESGDGMGALKETVQEGTERFINSWLEDNTRIWPARPQARGQIRLGVRIIRNTAFGVDIHTKRPMIRGNYLRHLRAVESICSRCAAADIPVLLYIAPARQDYEMPVIQKEYSDFKQDVQRIADEFGTAYTDLEQLVPSELFGMHRSSNLFRPQGVDFWHFKEAGHEILENAVGGRIESILTEKEN